MKEKTNGGKHMIFIDSLKKSGSSFVRTLRRFPVAVADFLLIFAALQIVQWYDYPANYEIFYKLITAAFFGAFFSVFMRLLYEKRVLKVLSAPVCVVTPVVLEALFFAMLCLVSESYALMSSIGLISVSALMCVYMLMKDDGDHRAVPNLVKNTVFCGFVISVLLVGISICVLAFTTLIFSDNSGNLFLTVTELLWVIAFPIMFMTFIPFEGEEFPMPAKAYKATVLYAELPVFLLLIGILYIYFIKILVLFSLPSGKIDWYASYAGVFYILNYMGLKYYEDKNKFARFFVRFGGLLMLPVVAVQCIAVGVRVANYGLTTARTASIAFIVVTVAFMVSSLVKAFDIKKAFLFSSALLLVLTVSPLNFMSIPVYQQSAALKNVLSKNGMLDGEAIVPNGDIVDEDKAKIISAYDYLMYYAPDEITPSYIAETSAEAFEDVFGFEKSYYTLYGNEDRDYGRDTEPYVYDDYYYTFCNYDFLKQEEWRDISEYDGIIYTSKTYDEEEVPYIFYTDGQGRTRSYNVDFIAEYLIENCAETNTGGYYKIDEGAFSLDDGVDFYLLNMYVVRHGDSEPYAEEIEGYFLVKGENPAALSTSDTAES